MPNLLVNFNKNSRLRKGKGQEGARTSRYLKRLSNKYGKNSKNNERNQILDLERKRATKGLEKSANVAKIARVTRIFIAVIEKDFKKYRINTKINKFCKLLYLRRTKLKKALQRSTNFAKIANENFALLKKKLTNIARIL